MLDGVDREGKTLIDAEVEAVVDAEDEPEVGPVVDIYVDTRAGDERDCINIELNLFAIPFPAAAPPLANTVVGRPVLKA